MVERLDLLDFLTVEALVAHHEDASRASLDALARDAWGEMPRLSALCGRFEGAARVEKRRAGSDQRLDRPRSRGVEVDISGTLNADGVETICSSGGDVGYQSHFDADNGQSVEAAFGEIITVGANT